MVIVDVIACKEKDVSLLPRALPALQSQKVAEETRTAAALAASLELLAGMGFGDRARNEALLRRHGNDVQVRLL